jgi:hypothetical protein
MWAQPVVTSVTFFLDGTAMVSDQYGRPIRGLVLDDGRVVLFAPTPPEANMERTIAARPQYATHAQVVAALALDLRIDLIGEMNAAGVPCHHCKGTGKASGDRRCAACGGAGRKRVIVCAGWPQLPAEALAKIARLPPTPESDLRQIPDRKLREAALAARRGTDEESEADEVTA